MFDLGEKLVVPLREAARRITAQLHVTPSTVPSRLIGLDDPLDWFAAPRSVLSMLSGVPGLRWNARFPHVVLVHRSHLPLLPLAHRVCMRPAVQDRYLPFFLHLRDYQQVGAEFIQGRRGSLLADSMRLGKTLEVIAAHDPVSGPLVVCAPLSVKPVWLTWMRRRWPDIEPFIVKGQQFDHGSMEPPPLVFIHYDVLPFWSSLGFGSGIGTLVFDEAHVLSNHRSHRSRSARYLATQATKVVLATGTPLWNQPVGLYSLLQTLAPGAWDGWKGFVERYCDGHVGAYGWVAKGSSNEDEFRARLSEVMLRRTWQDVQNDLPVIDRRVEIVKLTPEQADAIQLAAMAVKDRAKTSIPVGELARLRRLLSMVKLETAARLAKQLMDKGEPCVIWAWHRETVEALGRILGGGAHVIHGGIDESTRSEILSVWSERGLALCITMGVGQVGIDLSRAKHAILSELDFTPSVLAQAEMRTFSITRPMDITYIVADHDVDQKLAEVLHEKIDMSFRLGVPAADTSLDLIGRVFGIGDQGDLDRLKWAVVGEVCNIATPRGDAIEREVRHAGSNWAP